MDQPIRRVGEDGEERSQFAWTESQKELNLISTNEVTQQKALTEYTMSNVLYIVCVNFE